MAGLPIWWGFPAASTQRRRARFRQLVLSSVEEGAEIIVRMAQIGPDGPTGGYFDANGPVAW